MAIEEIPMLYKRWYALWYSQGYDDWIRRNINLMSVQEKINNLSDEDKNKLSDGYHTFWELYEHRCMLWIKLCMICANSSPYEEIWMSKKHSDGSKIEWWFVLWMWKDAWIQITYHLPMKYFGMCKMFAKEKLKAHKFDWHTSRDVLNRLENL